MGMRISADVERRCLELAGETARQPQPLFASEKEFQQWVIDRARGLGWRYFHTHDSRRSPAGFPDLVLVRERVIYAELKTDDGQPTADQLNWIDDLRAAGEEVYLWRPADVADVLRILTERKQPGVST